MQEVKKPRPAVDKMLSAVKNLVSEFSQGFQLKIFKPGEKLSFEELIVKETKKVFLLYDSLEDSIEEKKILDEGLITLGGVFERLIARGESRKAVESRLLDFLDRKRKDGKFSECFVPLVVEGGVAGCLRLSNDLDYHRSIKPALAVKAMEYVSVLVGGARQVRLLQPQERRAVQDPGRQPISRRTALSFGGIEAQRLYYKGVRSSPGAALRGEADAGPGHRVQDRGGDLLVRREVPGNLGRGREVHRRIVVKRRGTR